VTLLTLSGPCNDHTLSQLPSQFPGLVSLQLLGSYYASDQWVCLHLLLLHSCGWLVLSLSSASTFVCLYCITASCYLLATICLLELVCTTASWCLCLSCVLSVSVAYDHDCCSVIVCRGLKRLCKAPQLSALLLDGCEHVTEYGLEVLIRGGVQQCACIYQP
jgi:hypothetical protein